jgi:hypothetical protein
MAHGISDRAQQAARRKGTTEMPGSPQRQQGQPLLALRIATLPALFSDDINRVRGDVDGELIEPLHQDMLERVPAARGVRHCT